MARRVRRSTRITTFILALCASGLITALGVLHMIGPPPVIGIDALWVHRHHDEVRIGAIGLLVAVAGSMFAWLCNTKRAMHLGLWTLAIVAAIALFADRIPALVRVLVDHAS